MTRSPAPVPTPLELLANLLLGAERGAPALAPATGIGVRAAFEGVLLPALSRPPCVVSFSGGRDSSAILALATDVARRHGLPDPVPATLRFPDSPGTDEEQWQRMVLEHLGIDRQEIVELRNELDALGPAATATLTHDGVRWPGNRYMHEPLIALAAGGSLLTGGGGDELLASRASLHVVLARERRLPRRGELRPLARAILPRPLRRELWRRRGALPTPWLTPAGGKLVSAGLAVEEVGWPHRWDRSVGHWFGSRAFAGLSTTLDSIGERHDVEVLHPFLAPAVLAELAEAGGRAGFPSRAEAMRRLVGDLLPEAVLTRETKATFSGAVFGAATREFASGWSGKGVDVEHVDVERLRAEWLSERPDFRTVLLLQGAWLDARPAGQPSASSS